MIQFNTVEGLVLNLRTRYRQRFEDFRFYQIAPEVRYGFSSEQLYSQVKARYYYNPLKFASAYFEAGHFVEDLHQGTSLKPFDNTYYSLVLEKNYRKIYQRSYVKARHNSELINGVYLDASLLWEQRSPLFNTTDYAFRDNDGRTYTPNNPANLELMTTEFPRHQALILGFEVEWQPGQRYVKRPYRKFVIEKKYPAIILDYQAAVSGVLGSDVAFQKASLGCKPSDQSRVMGFSPLLGQSAGHLSPMTACRLLISNISMAIAPSLAISVWAISSCWIITYTALPSLLRKHITSIISMALLSTRYLI